MKWTGSRCATQRQYKFWVDDTVTTDTAWLIKLRDGTELSSNWTSANGGPLFGLGASEATALTTTGPCTDGGVLYLDRTTRTLTLNSCATCTPLLWFQYANVVPLVAGNFIKGINISLQ